MSVVADVLTCPHVPSCLLIEVTKPLGGKKDPQMQQGESHLQFASSSHHICLVDYLMLLSCLIQEENGMEKLGQNFRMGRDFRAHPTKEFSNCGWSHRGS